MTITLQISEQFSEMYIVQEDDLGQFVEELRQQWPQSLLVYMLAKNHLERNRFAWPNIEFVVDKFPHHSACVARPIAEENKIKGKDYPPRMPASTYTISGKDGESMRSLLQEPVVDWTVPCTFGTTPIHLAEALNGVCRQHGNIIDRPDWKAFGLVFRQGYLKPGPALPDGFTVRPLNRSDIYEVNSTWGMGRSPECLRTFLYLYDQGFPTIGAYDPDNKLAGFALCCTEMYLIAAYVKPEYRNKKIFRSMAYAMCEAIFALGYELTFALVSEQNVASHTSMQNLGGERANWEVCWTLFVPKGYDNLSDPLLVWYHNLGKLLWEQK